MTKKEPLLTKIEFDNTAVNQHSQRDRARRVIKESKISFNNNYNKYITNIIIIHFYSYYYY